MRLNPENHPDLKNLLIAGWSASQIALHFNVTRNAVVGYVRRHRAEIGAKFTRKSTRSNLNRPPKKRYKPKPTPVVRSKPLPPPKPTDHAAYDATSLKFTCLELPSTGCKYITHRENNEWLFCGHRQSQDKFGLSESSYCDHHRSRCIDKTIVVRKSPQKRMYRV